MGVAKYGFKSSSDKGRFHPDVGRGPNAVTGSAGATGRDLKHPSGEATGGDEPRGDAPKTSTGALPSGTYGSKDAYGCPEGVQKNSGLKAPRGTKF